MTTLSQLRPTLVGYRTGPMALSAVIVGVTLATALPVALGVAVDATLAIGSKVVLCGLAIVLLTSLRWWGRTGFLALPARRDLVWLALPALLVSGALVAVLAAGAAPMEPMLLLAFAIVALGAGFSEEALFRGALLESMRPWGNAPAMVGTTAAFALIHFGGVLAGSTLEATLAQVVLGGIPFGLAFAGLRLATRSIWPLIAIHAVNNLTSYLMSGRWEAVAPETNRYAIAGTIQFAMLLVLAAYGAWFLWRFMRDRRTAVR